MRKESWSKEHRAEQTRKWYHQMKGDPERYAEYKRKKRQNYLCINGKVIRVNKRPRPDDVCEVCHKRTTKLNYHHWDDTNPEWGIWVCGSCHGVVEGLEKGLVSAYIRLKQLICSNTDIVR